jgi:tocopherol cyclase
MHYNRYLPRIYRPALFQGKKNRKGYFEGWYFKLVDSRGDHVWSIIPGVSYSNDAHSFIQIIHAISGKTYYQSYPIESFYYSRKEFLINVGPNSFSEQKLSLDVSCEELVLKGEISFGNRHPFPVKLFSPGIMGWYTFVPFMECYHAVVSMQHELSGSLEINGTDVGFNGGKGYIEKDWGRSMPTDWIWIQSNHFKHHEDASFMFSLARIPWLKGYFPGFLSYLLINGLVYRFATYNRSQIELLEVKEEFVTVVLRNRRYQLTVKAQRKDGGVLKAPRHGAMERNIKESIISTIDLELKNNQGKLLFSDTGQYSGLEIVGDMEQYF